ncbi:MAG: hypothetical protein NTZ87_03840 [Candidatus Nomurabacteria bacterium]|nr:hypothetical protein [Candidatus Nomurabacteria bacterium]
MDRIDRKKLIKRLICFILFIFIVNFVANKFYWYYTIWYFDMPMHFLGGFWIGLASLYFLFTESKALTFQFIIKILLCVLLVGIGWEVFEILVNNVTIRDSFNYLDTFSDILFDLSGGVFAILYFFKRIMLTEGNKVK